jgi:hypothetical protein
MPVVRELGSVSAAPHRKLSSLSSLSTLLPSLPPADRSRMMQTHVVPALALCLSHHPPVIAHGVGGVTAAAAAVDGWRLQAAVLRFIRDECGSGDVAPLFTPLSSLLSSLLAVSTHPRDATAAAMLTTVETALTSTTDCDDGACRVVDATPLMCASTGCSRVTVWSI